MSYNLQGISLLSPRPDNRGADLVELINASAGFATQLNVVEIVYSITSENIHNLQDLNSYDLVIFTSVYAVKGSFRYCPSYTNDKVIIAAIGEETAKSVSNYCDVNSLILPKGTPNSENLLSLPELLNVSGKKIAIISGEGGRDLLKKTLSERGACVSEITCYKRKVPDKLAKNLLLLDVDKYDWVLGTSQICLENLLGSASENQKHKLLTKNIIVISDRLVKLVEDLGFKKKPFKAENSSNSAILKVLVEQGVKDDRKG